MSNEVSASKVHAIGPRVAGIEGRDLQFILESAILAPSADNHHRIRFSGTEGALSIRGTEPALPTVRYRRVLALLSLGAVVENLDIAASQSGIAAKVALLPEPSDPQLLVRIRFEQQASSPDHASLCAAIPLRHTNRRLRFGGPPLTSADRASLDLAVREFPGCALVWLNGAEQRRPIVELVRRAESERFRNRLLHDEIFSSIHFDAGWQSSTPEGLPPGALAIEAPMRPVFAMLRHWPIMRVANFLGLYRLLGFRAASLPCRLAPDMLLVTAQAIDDPSVFDAGRALQRTWLGLTDLRRVAQPLPAAAIYALPEASRDDIPDRLRQDLAEAWKRHLPSNAIPLMVLRVGQARASRANAGRPPVERFCKF